MYERKGFRSEKNVLRICSETLLKSLTNLSKKIINRQLDIKLGQFTVEELDAELKKKFKNRKAAGLDEIPLKVCKIRKFDDILLQLCNLVYKRNTK